MIYLTEKRKEIKYISIFKNDLISKLQSDNYKNIHNKRKVFSIYYDTDTLLFFKNHIDGNDIRSKYRLRSYNINLKKKNIFNFENKIKEYDFNYKKIIKNYITINNIETRIPNLNILKFGNLSPILAVSYDREYFYNEYLKNRITIDSNIFFYPIMKNLIDFSKNKTLKNLCVKEEKIPKESIKKINYDTVKKFSKYIYGVNYLNKNRYDFY